MLQVKYDILKDIFKGEHIFEYDNLEKTNELLDKKIIKIDSITFDDYIKDYANKNDLELLYNGYQYDCGFKSGNDKAIKKYTLYPNTIFMPLSDPLLGLISNFIDEYDSYDSNTFEARSYEVFKLISEEMKGQAIIVFDYE